MIILIIFTQSALIVSYFANMYNNAVLAQLGYCHCCYSRSQRDQGALQLLHMFLYMHRFYLKYHKSSEVICLVASKPKVVHKVSTVMSSAAGKKELTTLQSVLTDENEEETFLFLLAETGGGHLSLIILAMKTSLHLFLFFPVFEDKTIPPFTFPSSSLPVKLIS